MKKEIVTAAVSSRGQVTIPLAIRKLLHLEQPGEIVGFEPVKGGVILKRLIITETEVGFDDREWEELERLANQPGKRYNQAQELLKDIDKL